LVSLIQGIICVSTKCYGLMVYDATSVWLVAVNSDTGVYLRVENETRRFSNRIAQTQLIKFTYSHFNVDSRKRKWKIWRRVGVVVGLED